MSKEQKADVIAKSFVKQYYEKLQSKPKDLFLFYKDESSFSHAVDGNNAEVITGLASIREKVNALEYGEVSIDLTHGSIDAQSFESTSVFITVTGKFVRNGSAPRAFVQSFLLVLQGETKSYFVLNSTFRVLSASILEKESSTTVSVLTTTKSSQTPAAESSHASTSTEVASVPVHPAPVVEPVVEKPAETTAPAVKNEKKEEGGGRKRNKKENSEPKPEAVDTSAGGSLSFADLVRGWGTGENPANAQAAQPTHVPVVEQQPVAQQKKQQKKQPEPAPAAAPVAEKAKKDNGREKQAKPASETENKGRGKPQMPTLTSLYVHNVPQGATVAELKSLFSQFGKVLRVDAHQDRGFAFVNFEHQDVVKAALNSEPVHCCGSILKIESRDRSNDGIGKIASPHANRSAKKDDGKRGSTPTEKSKDSQ